jgi:uncharacterized peroxidase-related enzyme
MYMAWIEESELPDVPAIFQAMSIKPEALNVVKRLNEVLSFGNSGLSRIQEEGIATVVSVANRCRYGAMTHAGFLRRHSKDLDMASHFLCDYTQAPLSSTDRRILDFAVQVTQEPSGLTEDDVDQLRDAGLDEPQILSVVLIACLSNFMDRLANSLGVDLEPRHRRALDNWLTGPAAQQDWLMPPPARPQADTAKKAKQGLFDGKAAHSGDSPNGKAALPEEEPFEPEPEDSLTEVSEFLSDLEDIINSDPFTNGSASADESEDDLLDVPTFEMKETDTGEETNSVSDFESPSPNGVAYPVSQDDATEEEVANPMTGENYLPSDNENSMAGEPGNQVGDVSETPSGQSLEAGPGEQTGGAPEATYAPVSGTEENPEEQSEAGEDAADEPKQSQETEEEGEPEPPIDVDPLILRFVEECCKTGDDRSATAKELYIAYLRWCDEHDKITLRQRDFGINLSGMGFLRQRRAGGRHWWIGVGMTAKDDWSDEDL